MTGLAGGALAALMVISGAQDTNAPVEGDAAARMATLSPTLYPRALPPVDRHGDAFADRVSISPNGRRLAVGTPLDGSFGIQVVGVTRKTVETERLFDGSFEWVGWADDDTLLMGTRAPGNGQGRVLSLDLSSGQTGIAAEGSSSGVLGLTREGEPLLVSAGGPPAPCPSGGDLPTRYEDRPASPIGPADRTGLVAFAVPGGVVMFECEADAFAPSMTSGADGAMFDAGQRRYVGTWSGTTPSYGNASLAYEMAEVASTFDEPVDVYPIESARSPNTLLLYVVGERTPGGYYVLDRYAGQLDLHVTFRASERPAAE